MKKLIVLVLAMLALSAGVGGSYAWFSDTVSADDNVIISGSVQILQREQARQKISGGYAGTLADYAQHQILAPVVQSGPVGYDEVSVGGTTVRLRSAATRNYVDKIVTVTNAGVSPAYVRTFIAIPTMGHTSATPIDDNWIHWDALHGDDTWSWGVQGAQSWPVSRPEDWNRIDNAWIGGTEYDIYVATYTNKLMPGQTTAPSLLGFYLDSALSNDNTTFFFTNTAGQRIYLTGSGNMEILVATQAAQTTTFADPWTALDTVFGAPAADNHPWVNANTVYAGSNAELSAALRAGAVIRLAAGTYDLPAQLPAAVRIVGQEDGVILRAPAAISGTVVEFTNVTFEGSVRFIGSGEFDHVTFGGDFTALFTNPAYLTGCVFGGACTWEVTEEAVRSTVVFENCQ